MKTMNTRALVEGAVLAALTAIMGIFYTVPFLDVITLFWAVPIIIVGYRNGFKVSLLAAFIAAVLIGLINSPIIGIILFLAYALPGAIMGNMMKKNINVYVTLGVGSIILSFSVVVEIILSLELILGSNITYILTHLGEALTSYYNMLLNQGKQSASILISFGFDEAIVIQVIEMFRSLLNSLVIRIPVILLLTGIATSYMNYTVVQLILNRTGHKIENTKNLLDWKFDKNVKWMLLAITLLVFMFMDSKIKPIYIICVNLLGVLEIIYFMLGLSLVAYIMRRLFFRTKFSRPVQVIIMFLITLFLVPVMVYIGMFDMVADIRRIDRISTGGVQ